MAEPQRNKQPKPDWARRGRLCPCGQPETHYGTNGQGVSLTAGCEPCIDVWLAGGRGPGRHDAQPGRFRKRPVVIEAQQLTPANADELATWSGGYTDVHEIARVLVAVHIETLEGLMRADVGDWIIKGVAGEFYPCKPDIFAATYEPADSTVLESTGVVKYSNDGVVVVHLDDIYPNPAPAIGNRIVIRMGGALDGDRPMGTMTGGVGAVTAAYGERPRQ